jgi:hypothetical protein
VVNIEADTFREFAQGLGSCDLGDGAGTERIQGYCVATFLKLDHRIPLQVLLWFVALAEFLDLLFLTVARLDEVTQLQGVKVQFNADNSLSRRVESLRERYWVVPLGSHTEF